MESTMTTELKISSHTFNWLIPRFDILCPRGCTEFCKITSECFTAGEDIDKKSKWFVTLDGRSGHISFFLYLKSRADETDDFETLPCYFDISLGNSENRQICGSTQHEFASGINWGNEVISIAELYEKEATLLRNNTLDIRVQMKIHGRHCTTLTALPLNRKKNSNPLQVLSADFLEMMNNKKRSDVEIICGTETFHAHKLILSARSKVFSAMFEAQMQESVTRKVSLTDIDADIFHAILLYIYTGKVEVNDVISYIDLIHGAEKYDLTELKQHCFEQLCERITDETIGILAVAAEKYNADIETKECVKEYCQRNITTFLKNPAFKNLVLTQPNAFF